VNSSGLQKIPGFETTDYAYLRGTIVWAGEQASTNHPRNALSPWQPETLTFNADRLHEGAVICSFLFEENHPLAKSATGLMLWLQNKAMPFPMSRSVARFNAIKQALICNDLDAFTSAAIRLLGLGNGLTPSGDDFVGGIMFAMEHAPRQAWAEGLPVTKTRIRNAACMSTNVISAALLDDMMAGKSYSALHDVVFALHSNNVNSIVSACEKLLTVGASSGADMLAGLLIALTTQHQPNANQSSCKKTLKAFEK
jgi:Protein of unknown function (DUF2877)